jgi:hydroxymethylbilane synthase
MSIDPIVKIGTRQSPLALWQANSVKASLEERFSSFRVELVGIKTQGDKILDVPLANVGGKGLFVKEIEEALLRGTVDLAVHSMKDVPTDLPADLHLAAIMKREDPGDVLISSEKKRLAELKQKAVIGTSSLRRQSQLKHYRPDLEMRSLRGNIDTRLRKLGRDGIDGIILAAAGIKRMGWMDRVTEPISYEICLPAIGQGAMGIETRKQDAKVRELVAFLNHPETASCVLAERAFLKRLEGGCQVPIAGHGRIEQGQLKLEGLVASVDGARLVRNRISGPPEEAEMLGIRLAERLLSAGAGEILKEIYQAGVSEPAPP